MRKQWVNPITERPLTKGCGGHAISYGIVIGFSKNLNKMYNFEWKKGGQLPSNFLALWPLIFVQMRSNFVQLSLFRYSRTIGLMQSPHGKTIKEKTKTNKRASVMFIMAKNTKLRIFEDGSFKVLQQGCWIRWIIWCDFH